MELTHLSLFSGIGGLDLAAEWAGFKTVGQCEWAEYPTKVLEKHWPDVTRWRDIRTLTGESFYERTGLRTVDIISGGFPCQPFSVAGKQRGKEDDRYLWPEMVRVIKELRPTWVVGENVAGIVRMALPDILSELEACGYRTRTFLIPACAVGARHRRYRVAIVAYTDQRKSGSTDEPEPGEETFAEFSPNGAGSERIVGYSKHNGLSAATVTGGVAETGRGKQEGKKETGEFAGTGKSGNSDDVAYTKGKQDRWIQQSGIRANVGANSKDVQHTDCTGCEEQHMAREPDKQGFPGGGCDEENVCNATGKGLQNRTGKPMGGQGTPEQELERPARRSVKPGLGGVADGISDWLDGDIDFLLNHYWDTEPDIPRIATGISNRVGRLKALGNAVVPQQFYPIFNAIAAIESMQEELDGK